MAIRSLVISLASVLLLSLSACGAELDSDAPPAEIPRGLVVEQPDDARALGSFADDEHALRFRSEIADGGFVVEVELNGMTLVAERDDENVRYDAYASETGGPTQLTDADRAALAALSAALDELGEVAAPLARLRSFANHWSEFPSTLEPSGEVYLGFRDYSSLCWAQDSFFQVTHDCWSYNNWADATTYYAYIGMQPEAPCAEGTYFWVNSSWACLNKEPDHSTSIEYAYGSCFGRCGAGCGSDSQLTVDCADHDSCVRFGHDLASMWCNDEFSATIDDWASAPNCN